MAAGSAGSGRDREEAWTRLREKRWERERRAGWTSFGWDDRRERRIGESTEMQSANEIPRSGAATAAAEGEGQRDWRRSRADFAAETMLECLRQEAFLMI